MKKISPIFLLTFILLIQSTSTRAVTSLIAGWDFQTTATGGTAAAAAPSAPTTYAANFGTGNIYMNGTNGASSWVTATSGNEVTSFGGSNLNTSGTSLSTVTSGSSALAIVGGVGGTAANGKFIVFKFSMTGFTNLSLTYATQKTATGFGTQTWEYSTNGTTWFSVGAVTTIPTSFAVQTFSGITGLDNAATAYLRLTPTGASNASGNNRIDNIQLNATAGGASVSASALTSFGSVCTGTTAGPNSFTITGTSLSTANVTVGALSGYTYSTTSGGTYTTSLSLTQPGGAYSQQIFVDFNPSLVQSYNGNIPVGGGGASSINVAAVGSGINTLPTVVTGSTSGITTTFATCAGSITVNGCSPTTAYGIEYSLTNGFTPGTGTQVASTNISGGNFTSDLTPLLPGTTYYYRAYATTAVSTYYGSQSSFLTTALVATLSSGSLASFGSVCTGSTAGPNSFTITGSGLTTANVNVGPLTGYTFSTTSGGSYTTSLSLTQPGGAYSQAIFVKFSPTLVQSYAGNIPVNGGGALLPSDVAADGTGVAPPSQPSAIVGLAAPCKNTTGVTYSVTNVPGTTYAWTFPTGWTQTAGTNTNSVIVTTTTTSGTVTVIPNNGFCNGPAQTLAVAPINIPSTPSAIVGSAGVCSGATGLTYSVTNVSGITYTWVLPSGWSQTAGGTINSITVDAGTTGGTISVTPSNASCSGTAQTLVVSINALPVISSATSTTACTGGPVTLTVNGSNFSDYRWSDPAAATSGLVYQQNFNSLPSTGSVTWVDNTTIPGWYASSSNIATTGVNSGTGSNNAGGIYSFGAASASDRALGSLASGGSNTITYGVKLNNSTGAPVNRVFVQYTGEQWRDGGSGAVANSLTFSYSTTATTLTTGSYTAATALDYTSTVAAGGAA
ncbi:MAG: Fibronectin type domain protein, partial [Bacteroidetes bacterium]|nr:Fibronectin type domain protein [Bacteroidota bacterium]